MSRPAKKRALQDSSQSIVVARTTTETFGPGASSRLPSFVLEQELEALKSELERERDAQALARKVAAQTKERLEKQLQFCKEEANETQRSFDEYQRQSEQLTERLRSEKTRALNDLRQCQIQLLEANTPGAETSDDDDDDQRVAVGTGSSNSSAGFWKEKSRHFERMMKQNEKLNEELNEQLQVLRSELEKARVEQPPTVVEDPSLPPYSKEDAPSDLLRELTRVRNSLAESERRERQLTRQVKDVQRRNEVLVQEREEGKLAVQRLPVVQEQMEEIQVKYETLMAQHKAWNDFGQALDKVMDNKDKNIASRAGPPELSVVQRFLEDCKDRTRGAEQQKESLREEVKQVKATILPLETKLQEAAKAEQAAQREKREVDRKLENAERQVAQSETQQNLYKREIESLQNLIKTFDDLPLAGSSSGSSSTGPDGTKKALELSLSTAQEELKVIKLAKDTAAKELEASQSELERVKDKFGKLRDALHAERAKAEQAEQRANDAEALAGKGSFNPETTRVLHLEQTPLMEAMKEEIEVLKRQLVEAGKSKSAASAAADATKLNQRLKENFREQIGLFREGVYLATGYKVDMLPNTDRPTFRVRSMFAEQEEDHFLLKWPKTKEGGDDGVTSLDLLNTDLARQLTQTPSYQYITKFNSLQAYMASVQLHLFEKQTMVM